MYSWMSTFDNLKTDNKAEISSVFLTKGNGKLTCLIFSSHLWTKIVTLSHKNRSVRQAMGHYR